MSDQICRLDVPAGRWGVAVSGGADSVGLLELLRHQAGLSLHVVHLDHETRSGQSTADARFVEALAKEWGLPCTIARRSEIESGQSKLDRNTSARYRAARLELFRRVADAQKLDGVILAHHAADQAETIFQRLLRGSGVGGLGGMAHRATVRGVTILRPLLGVKPETLREMLRARGISWREDASNQSSAQQRNRVRPMLVRYPRVADSAIEFGRACEAMNSWLRENSPELADEFAIEDVARLSPALARESLRRWLAARAGADAEITSSAVSRLLEMATDCATPARGNFARGLSVRRRGGRIGIERGAG